MPRDENETTANGASDADDPAALQNKFKAWKKKKEARAAKKAKRRAEAKGTNAKETPGSKPDATAVAALAEPKLKPRVSYVAAAYDPSAEQDLLDKVTTFFTTDAGFLASAQSWLEDRGGDADEVTLKRVGDGEYPVELHSLWKEYEDMIELKIEEYIALEGGSLADLFSLARDRSKEAYSDANMFVQLLSACTTFKFFVDMLQRAQGGNLTFTTTRGLDPSYNV
jgi:hypothetical protein